MKRITLNIILVIGLILASISTVFAETIPNITIMGVTEDDKVTVTTKNFPANKEFQILMGKMGTKGVGGIQAGTIDSGDGGSFSVTVDIPEDLYDENLIAIRFESVTGGYYSYNWFENKTFGTHEDGTPAEEPKEEPTISVTSVKKDEYAVIKGVDFPIDESFDVLMGEADTEGMDGVLIDTIMAEEDGGFVLVFEIPEDLVSEEQIAVRFESKESDLVLHTTFKNETGASGGSDTDGGYTGIPTIAIVEVDTDESVTVRTNNFPAEKDFIVLMGKIGTKGVDGIEVATFNACEGGTMVKTVEIPEDLVGDYQIAIRLQTEDGIYYAYNWFYNNTSGTEMPSGYSGIPTFSITEVVEDEKVTIMTNNFPAEKEFEVLMGKMGTKGVDGTLVTTINAGEGGAFSQTFDIPDDLLGEYQIAIRLQTEDGYFYAYNWFYNNTSDEEPAPDPGYSGIPTFSITAVVKDDTVTIETNNFPAEMEFEVLMGEMGTKGVGGILVTTINSGEGGAFSQTFDIPEDLLGDYQIAIRLESTTGGFYAYNWFYNVTYP